MCKIYLSIAYVNTFEKVYDRMKNQMLDSNKPFDERLIRNFASILTPVKIIEQGRLLDVQLSYEDLYNQSLDMIAYQSTLISNSEAVANFWNTVEYMLDTALIKSGFDFKIEFTNRVINLKTRKETKQIIDFSENPKQLIYIKLGKIHPLYMESHRRQHGRNGVDLISLVHYIKQHPAFLGTIGSTRFEDSNTSAFVLDYDRLGINLVRTIGFDQNEADGQMFNESQSTPF